MVLSLHHLLFGGQVYHSLLLLGLFKLSFQCMELPAPLPLLVTGCTLVYSVCLYLCLCTLRSALHSWVGPPCYLPSPLRLSLELHALHPAVLGSVSRGVHCLRSFADHTPFPWHFCFGFSRLHFVFDSLTLKDGSRPCVFSRELYPGCIATRPVTSLVTTF